MSQTTTAPPPGTDAASGTGAGGWSRDSIQYLPRLLQAAAEQAPQDVALREKRYGIWQDITWADYQSNVEAVAYGLAALGVQAGDRVAIQSENRPEWLYTDLASNALRAAIVGVYPTNPVAEVRYLLTDSASRVLIAEDQEQVDKAIELIDELPELEWVVYLDGRGLADQEHPALISIDEMIERGRALREREADLLQRIDADRSPDDLVTLIYTSGTTGPPKGAMLSAANVDFGSATFVHAPGMFGDRGLADHDVLVSYLPLSHVVERAVTTWAGVRQRTVVHFAESIETVVADLAEVQPTVLFAVPRIWEKIQASVAIKMANSSRLKRAVFGVGQSFGQRAARSYREHGKHTVASSIYAMLAYVLLTRKLRRHLGLAKVRHALSGAAPISPQVLEFFLGLGVVIHEAYGMTENTAIATCNYPGRIRFGTVGQAQPGIELRLAEGTAEVLTRHPGNFVGYWNKPEATAEALDTEGWLHTGDVGEWTGPDGTHLAIVDRIKDIIITAGGKNISPSEIENAIKASPYVREAVVIGDKRAYLTALIGIEYDTVADWAGRRNIEYTTYKDLSTKAETVELVGQIIREVNTTFARVEAVRKYRMLHKQLDHEDGELTATQKLKRNAFAATVSHLVDDMYDNTTEHAGGDLGRSG